MLKARFTTTSTVCTSGPSYLQLYFYDTEHEVANRIGAKEKLQEPIIERLTHVLSPNPYSKFFRSLREVLDIEKCDIRLKADPKIINAAPPSVPQIAAIWMEDENASELQEHKSGSNT